MPTLVDARTLIERFQIMIRKKVEAELDTWIIDGGSSLVASFASGITNDADRSVPQYLSLGPTSSWKESTPSSSSSSARCMGGKNRPSSIPTGRCSVQSLSITEIASEPKLDA